MRLNLAGLGHLAIVLVAFLLLTTGACRGAPTGEPQSGQSATQQPEFPVVAPPGVPAVTGNGTLALVPAGDGQTIPVPADLGRGWLATVYVRSQPSAPMLLRLQVLPDASITPPPVTAGPSIMFSLEFFDASTGALVTPSSGSTSIAIQPPDASDISQFTVLRRISSDGRDFEALTTSRNASSNSIGARLPDASALTLIVAPWTATARAQPTQEVLTTALGNRAPLPQRLRIAAIGVDAPISPLGLEPSGIMASPTEGHVIGWYELGPRPGESSNAILAGHVDWNKQLAVFAYLSKLQPGTAIDVLSGVDRRYRYEVEDVKLYAADDAPLAEIFGATPGPALTLITCGGAFDQARNEYLERVVVRARGV